MAVICSYEHMRLSQLENALDRLKGGLVEVEAILAEIRAHPDPLARHIFVARHDYRQAPDTKSGKRRETMARLSFNTAVDLGFRGSLAEWQRLLEAGRAH